jgi:hypothetical protein
MTKSPDRTKSRLFFIVVAGGGFLLALALLFSYVLLASRLLAAGFQDQFFYVVLIVAGVVATTFLVGGMRAHDARVTVNQFGIKMQARGGIAIFVFVVVGGLYVVPRDTSFNLTIRPHAPRQPIVTAGSIRVNYGDNSVDRILDSNGEANFKQIPHRYWGTRIQILPDVEGFQHEYQEFQVNSTVIDLDLVLDNPESQFSGTIEPLVRKPDRVRIVVEGEGNVATPDEFGRFQMLVHHKKGDRIRVRVFNNDQEVSDTFEILPGPTTIRTHKPRK